MLIRNNLIDRTYKININNINSNSSNHLIQTNSHEVI